MSNNHCNYDTDCKIYGPKSCCLFTKFVSVPDEINALNVAKIYFITLFIGTPKVGDSRRVCVPYPVVGTLT